MTNKHSWTLHFFLQWRCDDGILMAGNLNPNWRVLPHVEPHAELVPYIDKTNTSTASSGHNISDTCHCIQMSGFLNTDGTAICSAAHDTALIGVLQVAWGHPDGIVGALGHNNCTSWIWENLGALFREDLPLSLFLLISEHVFQRHFGQAQTFACSMFDWDHSNDRTGVRHEDFPEWVCYFYRLFEEQQNQEALGASSLRARNKWCDIAMSLIGHQAPLGPPAVDNLHGRQESTDNSGIREHFFSPFGPLLPWHVVV